MAASHFFSGVFSNWDVVACVMIQKKRAVDELEKVLAVSGLDMVQWRR